MTRQGIAVLVDLLRDRPGPSSFEESNWIELLRVADEENVLPILASRLRGSATDLAPQQRAELDDIERKARFSAFVSTETLKTVLKEFHAAELPAIALKGPSLAERFYGDTALRTYADLDLLVRRADLGRAERLLERLRFAAIGHPDDYHQSWVRNGVRLELHHGVDHPLAFEFDLGRAWSRAHPAQFAGVPVHLFAAPDELFYLCLHAVRHRFDRLCLLVDLARAFRHLSPDYISLAAPGSSSNNILTLGWLMAVRLDNSLPVPPGSDFLSRDHARLQRLAQQLWREHMAEPAQRLDWAAQHRFYLQVESPGRQRMLRRWRHWRILSSRLIDADYEFAACLRLHRAWQARLLRPIRLLTRGA